MTTSVPSIAYLPSSETSNSIQLDSLWRRLKLMWQVQRERNALGDLDNRMLEDIGLDRKSVAAEANRSFFDLPAGRA